MIRSRFVSILLSGFLLLAAGSCSTDTPTGPVPGLGNVTVTKYVAIGNSLTAGFQSNSLYASSQAYSFPLLIAGQLAKAGAHVGSFEQPLFSDPGTPDGGGSATRLEITGFSNGLPEIGVRGGAAGTPTNGALARPFDNLGMPYAPLASFLDTANSVPGPVGFFFGVVLRPGGSLPKSVYQQVVALQPDLITFWLGNNDVLGFATSGGVSPSAPTPEGVFSAMYMQAIDTLRDALPDARIVLGNIPDVTTIPFFTTIGPIIQAQRVSALWGVRSNGDTVLMDLSTSLLALTAQEELEATKGFARSNPISNSVILDSDEIIMAQNATNAFNGTIAAAAAAYNAVVFDINTLLKQVNEQGYSIAGEVYTTQFVAGGLFSLDGVHPSSRGYAIVANEMLKVLNSSYEMDIPYVDVSTIPGIPLPLGKQTAMQGVPRLAKGALKDFHRLFSPEPIVP